ncbi:MAG: hypothetical protein Kow0090_13930 [Myxococcota bacterium]
MPNQPNPKCPTLNSLMSDGKEPLEIFKELIQRIQSISEDEGRKKSLFEFIKTTSPELFIEIFNLILYPPEGYSEKVIVLRDTLTRLLLLGAVDERLSYEEITELYRIASEKGYDAVARFFLAPPPVKVMDDAESPQLHRSISSTTLGMRRSLAKKPKKFLLDHLAKDGDPVVIRNILRNPRIVEQDVIKMTSRRPAPTVVLEEIFKHPRWKNNYRIRKALVFNPYTPPAISVKLVYSLLVADLRLCAQTINLHPLVLSAARDEIERRGGEKIADGVILEEEKGGDE